MLSFRLSLLALASAIAIACTSIPERDDDGPLIRSRARLDCRMPGMVRADAGAGFYMECSTGRLRRWADLKVGG